MANFGGLNKDHATGFVVGLGVTAAGYYLYMKNKAKVDETLAGYGIKLPAAGEQNLSTLTLEELMLKKETLEDLIAEKEMELEQNALPETAEPETKAKPKAKAK